MLVLLEHLRPGALSVPLCSTRTPRGRYPHSELRHSLRGHSRSGHPHRSYLDISRQAGDQEMQGRACVAYAECQHKLGQLEGAVDSLETFLQLSHSQVSTTRLVA